MNTTNNAEGFLRAAAAAARLARLDGGDPADLAAVGLLVEVFAEEIALLERAQSDLEIQ